MRNKIIVMAALAGAFVLPLSPELNQASFASDLGYPHSAALPHNAPAYEWWVDEDGNGRKWATPDPYDNDELMSSRGYYYRNCTDFVAWKLQSTNKYDNVRGLGHAAQWGQSARNRGVTVNMTATPGAVAWWGPNGGKGTFGHVAWVESVNGSSVTILQYNAGRKGEASRQTIAMNSVSGYIHFRDLTAQQPAAPAPSLAQYANSIVKWEKDDRTSWFVTPDLKRLWIPDGGTYNELKARGFAGPHRLSAAALDRLPDQQHQWVASGATWTGNRSLRKDMHVRSSDGRYRFILQGDGNLVLYGPSGRALWATDRVTSRWREQVRVIFQGDGNLVTYDAYNRPIWATGTNGRGATHFVVQGDGNLVIYAGARPLWASHTGGRT